MDAGDFETAGLYDPGAPRASDRLALLEHLVERGATLDDLVEAARLGRLTGLAGDLVRRHRRERLTTRELAERAGVTLEDLRLVIRAAGFPDPRPDEPLFTDQDTAAFEAFAFAVGFFGRDATLEFVRVIGAAMSSIADAALSLFGLEVRTRQIEDEVPELEQARTIEVASSALQDRVPLTIDVFFQRHVEAAIRRAQIAGAELSGGTAYRGAVVFLDLVDSTHSIQDLDARDLMSFVGDFEHSTTLAVAEREGRVVKHIGDEVMYVTTDAADACEIALELRERFDPASGRPALRGGIAFGDLIRAYGDFYGPLVNAAARAAKVAEPGTVLVTREVVDVAGSRPGLRFESRGTATLRGFDEPIELCAVDRA